MFNPKLCVGGYHVTARKKTGYVSMEITVDNRDKYFAIRFTSLTSADIFLDTLHIQHTIQTMLSKAHVQKSNVDI